MFTLIILALIVFPYFLPIDDEKKRNASNKWLTINLIVLFTPFLIRNDSSLSIETVLLYFIWVPVFSVIHINLIRKRMKEVKKSNAARITEDEEKD